MEPLETRFCDVETITCPTVQSFGTFCTLLCDRSMKLASLIIFQGLEESRIVFRIDKIADRSRVIR